MNMHLSRRWSLRIFSTLLLFFAIYFWSNQQEQLEDQDQIKRKEEPSFYMVDAISKQYNQQGGIDFRMQSQRIYHFDSDNTTDLEQPHITLYQESSEPWQINAIEGRILASSEIIELWDDVIVQQDNSANPVTLTTDQLTLHTQGHFAESKEAVHIKTNSGTIDATGMNAYFKEGRIELLSKVSSVHIPK